MLIEKISSPIHLLAQVVERQSLILSSILELAMNAWGFMYSYSDRSIEVSPFSFASSDEMFDRAVICECIFFSVDSQHGTIFSLFAVISITFFVSHSVRAWWIVLALPSLNQLVWASFSSIFRV